VDTFPRTLAESSSRYGVRPAFIALIEEGEIVSDKNPKWGSEEFLKAIEDHDAETDPKRKESGQKYTKKDNNAEAEPKLKESGQKHTKKDNNTKGDNAGKTGRKKGK
jgi:hypothetical protein